MKLVKSLIVALVIMINLLIAQPSWADRPKLTNSPDYAEVTQSLNELLTVKNTPDQNEYTPEQLQQKLGELQLQKYILETARGWAQCRNETGKTLGIYAHKPKKSATSQENTLYFLANGQITENDWDCDGIYLPIGTKVAGLTAGDTQVQELTEPVALKIIDGTQLVVKTNAETGAIEFNVSPAKVLKAGEPNWLIPDLLSTDIDLKTPDAPIED